MKASQVIFIQIGIKGQSQIREMLARENLRENVDYLIFECPGRDVLDLVEPDLPQLVFTSHGPGCNAGFVAKSVKAKNPKAIVCGLTSFEVEEPARVMLDGVVD